MKVNFLYEAVDARNEFIYFQLLKGKKKIANWKCCTHWNYPLGMHRKKTSSDEGKLKEFVGPTLKWSSSTERRNEQHARTDG